MGGTLGRGGQGGDLDACCLLLRLDPILRRLLLDVGRRHRVVLGRDVREERGVEAVDVERTVLRHERDAVIELLQPEVWDVVVPTLCRRIERIGSACWPAEEPKQQRAQHSPAEQRQERESIPRREPRSVHTPLSDGSEQAASGALAKVRALCVACVSVVLLLCENKGKNREIMIYRKFYLNFVFYMFFKLFSKFQFSL